MTIQDQVSATKSSSKTTQNACAHLKTAPIRVKQKTKAKLDQLLRQANKNQVGRKVKADDLIAYSLGMITDGHLAEICNMTRSNKDRLELLFSKLCKEKSGISREEFLGMLLDGKLNVVDSGTDKKPTDM